MSRAGRSGINPIKAGASPHFREGRVKSLPDFLSVDLKRIKPFHDTVRYGYAVGRIRVLETQMLNSQRVERLVEADFDGALYILDEIAMGDYLDGVTSAQGVEEGLNAFLRGVYTSVSEMLPKDSFIMDFFLCRYDFHNLKALLKASMEEGEPRGLLEGMGLVSVEELRRGIENPASLPSPYRETAEEFAGGRADPSELDTIVDKYYLEYRLFLARRESNPFMIDFARTSMDLANLKLVLRGRNLGKEREFLEKVLVKGGFIPTGNLLDIYTDTPEVMLKRLQANLYYSRLLEMMEDTGEVLRLTDFDRRSDDYLMDMVRQTKRVSIGVEPIFAYIRARENEVLMVRMILIAKLHKIPPAAVDKMLRRLYLE
jgi:V/A-type H+-transporting ATPase subunit C